MLIIDDLAAPKVHRPSIQTSEKESFFLTPKKILEDGL